MENITNNNEVNLNYPKENNKAKEKKKKENDKKKNYDYIQQGFI